MYRFVKHVWKVEFPEQGDKGFAGISDVTYWSVGPSRPSDQSDAIVAGFLYMFVSIFL